MAADESNAPHAAPAAAVSPSHRSSNEGVSDASGEVVRAVVGARAEWHSLLDALSAERELRARVERERDTALQRVSELEALLVENDEELERTLNELQSITKAETARAAKAVEELRRERALATSALLREADAELERRLSSPPDSERSRDEAPATAFGQSAVDNQQPAADSCSSGGADVVVRALTSKLLEHRRARALASAQKIAQLAHQRNDYDGFAVLASAAAAAAADSTLSLSAATLLAESTPPPPPPEQARPLRSLGPRRSSSEGQLFTCGGSLLALPAPSGWQAFISTAGDDNGGAHTPPASPPFHGWVQF